MTLAQLLAIWRKVLPCSGIGFHLAKELAAAGVEVILGCRSKSRGQEALFAVLKAGGAGAQASLCLVDVSDPESVREAAQGLRRTYV